MSAECSSVAFLSLILRESSIISCTLSGTQKPGNQCPVTRSSNRAWAFFLRTSILHCYLFSDFSACVMHLSQSHISPSIWGIRHCNSSPQRAVLLFVAEEEAEGICLRISNPRCRLVYGTDSPNSISHSHCLMSVSPMMLLMVESAYRENSSSFIVSSSPPSSVGTHPDCHPRNISGRERVTSVKEIFMLGFSCLAYISDYHVLLHQHQCSSILPILLPYCIVNSHAGSINVSTMPTKV